jgi:hypothetical protein
MRQGPIPASGPSARTTGRGQGCPGNRDGDVRSKPEDSSEGDSPGNQESNPRSSPGSDEVSDLTSCSVRNGPTNLEGNGWRNVDRNSESNP